MFALLLKELTFIFCLLSHLVLCCVAALKSSPCIVHSAGYIIISVFSDRPKYSEKSDFLYVKTHVFYTVFCYFDPIWIDISLLIVCLVETRNYSILSLAFTASYLRVIEENLVSETLQSGSFPSLKELTCMFYLSSNIY